MKARVNILCLIILASFIAGCTRWSAQEVTETKARGELIGAALLQYKIEYGEFPTQLQALVPKFTEKIPSPTVGTRQWQYTMYPNGGGDYLLRIEGRFEFEPLLEISANGEWLFDTK